MARLQSINFLLMSRLLSNKDADVIKAAYEWANKSNGWSYISVQSQSNNEIMKTLDVGLILWSNNEIARNYCHFFCLVVVEFILEFYVNMSQTQESNQLAEMLQNNRKSVEEARMKALRSSQHRKLIEVCINKSYNMTVLASQI